MILNFLMFFFNFIGLIMVRSHYLMVLISLELIFIILFNLIYLYLNFFNFEYYFGLVYLILGVCESCLGLSLLVYLVRKMNLSYVNSFFLC
uniref:NADH dehydrogenase subunit 4L n=1 Tax=Perkinsiella saccharicida TaxID=312347 RepID=A0A7S4YYS8_9HEMI|nr:NADH dehydrogenase subunit 4L [Perkinsiella saccharicida]QBZ38039.1 NADH dehydrogenase subunit 4L [Perkinsiella saccharicida]